MDVTEALRIASDIYLDERTEHVEAIMALAPEVERLRAFAWRTDNPLDAKHTLRTVLAVVKGLRPASVLVVGTVGWGRGRMVLVSRETRSYYSWHDVVGWLDADALISVAEAAKGATNGR
jgi:hypothetical protein